MKKKSKELTWEQLSQFKSIWARQEQIEQASYRIDIELEDFLESGNPIIPLQTFCSRFKEGLHINVWIIRWLAEGIQKYLQSDFRKPLDQFLGLRRRGKRRSNNLWLKEQRNRILFNEIYYLRSLNVKEEAAINAVGSRFDDSVVWKIKGKEIRPLKYTYLRRLYFAHKKNHPSDYEIAIKKTSEWTLDRKKKFLETYKLSNASLKVMS